MTRIISGIAGSLRLASPAKSTRPTSDRVRESIFGRLESQDVLANAAVLDLYAGTGALALESLSRGSTIAVMVEQNKQAAAICENNSWAVARAIDKAGGEGEWHVIKDTVKGFLAGKGKAQVAEQGRNFNLVFIDPPYEVSNDELTENLSGLLEIITEDATVIVERSSRTPEPTWPDGYAMDDRKDYGDTSVFWLSRG